MKKTMAVAIIALSLTVGFILGSMHRGHITNGKEKLGDDCLTELREYLKKPNGAIWIDRLRIEPVNVERSYYKLTVKEGR
jgi:hypothetical protein